MSQTAIPFLFMRGGTSRGPYFHARDLPNDRDELAKVLISVIGSGHPFNIDGIGGGVAVTTKVAILSPSDDEWADVDFLFVQISVEDCLVDFKPSCGNILVGVGPAAIEMGMVAPKDGRTDVKIRAVNTGARIRSVVETPRGRVHYQGSTAIDGVPGTASPIELLFMDVVGGVTGAMFPTGSRKQVVDGIEVSCMDAAMPMVIARAREFGLTGYETPAELDANRNFYGRMEPIRQKAALLMGMGDVSKSVAPKFGLLAEAKTGGSAAVRYFMPWRCHPALAVTGSQCVSACLLAKGTVGEGLLTPMPASPAKIVLEHPMGQLEVVVDYVADDTDGTGFTLVSAGVVRTARLLARGEVFVPSSVWSGV